MCTVVRHDSVFKLKTEALIELFISFRVVIKKLLKLLLNLLFDIILNGGELTVVLKHFTGNVKRQIL